MTPQEKWMDKVARNKGNEFASQSKMEWSKSYHSALHYKCYGRKSVKLFLSNVTGKDSAKVSVSSQCDYGPISIEHYIM